MRRWLWLVLWLIGILFPLAWLRRFSPGYQLVFDSLFSPEWMHWVMHAGLYAGLSVLVCITFQLERSRHTLTKVILAAIGVGVLQEGLQLISGAQVFGWNTCLDLGIDTLGSIIGVGVFAGFRFFTDR